MPTDCKIVDIVHISGFGDQNTLMPCYLCVPHRKY